MVRTTTRSLVLSMLLCWVFQACNPTPETVEAERPNVIIIMTDDQGYGDLACHGNPHIQTPNLDALWQQSIRLTNFHVGTTCSPTRASLMTGRYCNRVGVWHTIAGRSQLDARENTMAGLFSDNGYRTGMFGKWHLGDSYPFRPHDRGFDEAVYHGGGGIWQQPDYWDNDYFDDTYFRNGVPEKFSGYCTDVWFDETLNFISDQSSRPFFAYLATNAPHGPFHVDSSYIKPYLGIEGIHPNFNGMITNFDDNMGRLTDSLRNWDLEQNTILIFLTDNGTARGASFDADGQLQRGFNAGMRGIKGSQYEGGHRVPCFWRWPAGKLEGGKDIDALTAHLDLLPTLVELLQLDNSSSMSSDGQSLVSLLRGENTNSWSDRILITDTQREEHPVKWKKSAVMKNSWRLIDREQLYNLERDPQQLQNIASENQEIVLELQEAYESWWQELEPSFSDFTRAVIGQPGIEEVVLYSHDWHEAENNLGEPNLGGEGTHYTPWNQTHIRNGLLVNGYWTVEIERRGTYNFGLRRWPVELNQPITSSIPEKEAVHGGNPLVEGKQIAISKARIEIAGEVMEKHVPADAHQIDFQIQLEAGPSQLKATFEGENNIRLGAYYVYVTQVAD